MSARSSRILAVSLALAVTAAACTSGSDGESVVDDTTTTSTGEATTTVAVVDDTTTTTEAVPEGPGMPLTGLAITDEAALNRSALVVKIDNHPRARPQTGLDLADIVFEVRSEGVTRFMAAFHSNTPEPLGPVRSSRTSDFDLLVGLDNPLYASSGANDFVARGLRSLAIQEVTALSLTSQYFRDGSRPRPHNLYINAGEMWALSDVTDPPAPWFSYRDGGESLPAAAEAISGPVTITYRGSPVVTHTWDADRSGWLRTQDGRPHTTIGGDQLAPENVVIMVADYVVSAADPISPEVVSVGTGQLFVLTDGHVIQGTWERATAESKPVLLDTSGNPIELTRGRTWVLMPEAGNVTLPN